MLFFKYYFIVNFHFNEIFLNEIYLLNILSKIGNNQFISKQFCFPYIFYSISLINR